MRSPRLKAGEDVTWTVKAAWDAANSPDSRPSLVDNGKVYRTFSPPTHAKVVSLTCEDEWNATATFTVYREDGAPLQYSADYDYDFANAGPRPKYPTQLTWIGSRAIGNPPHPQNARGVLMNLPGFILGAVGSKNFLDGYSVSGSGELHVGDILPLVHGVEAGAMRIGDSAPCP